MRSNPNRKSARGLLARRRAAPLSQITGCIISKPIDRSFLVPWSVNRTLRL